LALAAAEEKQDWRFGASPKIKSRPHAQRLWSNIFSASDVDN
jgi:hypothetical protein